MSTYEDKRVVVAGGTSGIGFATAKLLLGEGAQVLITGRSAGSVTAALEQLGERATGAASDAASLSAMDDLAERVEAEFGTVDALVVNAGITEFAPFESTPEEMYEELMRVNAKGPYFTVQKLAPLLVEGSGVVFTTSALNVIGYPMVSVYAATKAALRSMTRSVARELLDRRIRVNAVSPGPINTGVAEKSMPKEAAEQIRTHLASEIPQGRLGDPLEVAEAIVFLAFEATYTTGAELPVDGGGTQI
jgi:NAD(P)-dependent dehydrogenase (short-subunit alcohol dehydrogenase family)